PFTSIDERVGLPGTGYASLLFEDQLLLGTNNGLFTYQGLQEPYIDDNDYLTTIPGTRDKVYSLQNIDGQSFMAHHYGAYTISSNNKINRLSDASVIGWWKFLELNDHPDVLIGGTYNSIFLLRRVNGQWQVITKIAGLNESSRVMEEDTNGDIWMSHGYKGVFRFRLNAALDSITSLDFYDSNNGFPSNLLINVFKVNNRLIFTSEKGIYSFDKATDRFQLDQEFTELLGDQILIKEMSEDSNGNIYFIGDIASGKLTRTNTGTYKLDDMLFSNVKSNFNDELENITVIDIQNVLIGGKEGFIHYNPTKQVVRDNELNLLLRKVKVTAIADSTLFTGSFISEGAVSMVQPKALQPVLEYENNSMLFSFTTTDYDSELPSEYRYMLEGLSNSWSEWNDQNELGFTNLDEGRYTLHLQARNQWGVLSNELSYSFRIKPPFYRTALAYFIYFTVFAFSITSLILSLQGQYKRDQLKAVAEEQSKFVQKETELTVQAKKSEEEIITLKNEKLEAEISYKNRELANSTMHLISKNEFISKIKTQLDNLAHTSSIATGKELKRIAREIDKNISFDDDWKQFEIHFDQVHGDFSRRLKAAFPHLTNQDMKLCAYLKLNMTTKEIANMLNITVRGVELSRYRLRKKLELDRSVNLTDFILGF
ncbi:MAG: triple tyrosine motif-containing protein, partial [Bacteroidota bacterium]